MVEIPSAVEIIDDLAEESDFFSIGTNDLVQYLLAADRTNEKVAMYYNPYHPALLRSVKRIVKSAFTHKISVSICGDLGASPDFLPYFIGLGIRSFSIDPREIPTAQKAIEDIDSQKAEQLVHDILTMKHSQEIKKKLKSFYNNHSNPRE